MIDEKIKAEASRRYEFAIERDAFIAGANFGKEMRGEWIDARKQLPRFGTQVWVYCAIYGRFVATYEEIGRTGHGNWSKGREIGILPPTHWMEIVWPLPPEPGGE